MESFFDGESFAAIASLRLFVCAGALVADRLFERIFFAPWLHPVVLLGSLVERAERKFNRAGFVSRFWRGAFVCGGFVALAFGAGFLADRMLWQAGGGWGGWGLVWVGIGGSCVCGVVIAHASLDRHVGSVERALREGKLAQARGGLSHLVGRETRALSKDRVARGALESLAENCSDATIAPLFYYVLFGLGGLFAYKTLNTLDSMVGYRGARFGLFGRFAARLDDVANLVPSRITAWSFSFTAFCLRGLSGRDASRVLRRDALSVRDWVREGFVSSPNASHPEAAMAGALGVRVGGVREYRLHGEVWKAGEEIGDGGQPSWRDIRRARRFVQNAVWLLIAFAGGSVGGSWILFG